MRSFVTAKQRIDDRLNLLNQINSRTKFSDLNAATKWLKKMQKEINLLNSIPEVSQDTPIYSLVSVTCNDDAKTYFSKHYVKVGDLESIDRDRWVHLGLSVKNYQNLKRISAKYLKF